MKNRTVTKTRWNTPTELLNGLWIGRLIVGCELIMTTASIKLEPDEEVIAFPSNLKHGLLAV